MVVALQRESQIIYRLAFSHSLASFETESKTEPSRDTLVGLEKAFKTLRLNYRALWKLKYPNEREEIRDLHAIAKLIGELPPDVIPEATRDVAMEIPSPPAVKTFAQYCFDVFEQRRKVAEPEETQSDAELAGPSIPAMSFEDRRIALAKLKKAVNFESLRTEPEPTEPDQLRTPPKLYVPVREVDLFSRAGLQALMGAGEEHEGLELRVGEGRQVPDADFFAFMLDVLRYAHQSGFEVNSKITFELKEVLEWQGQEDSESNCADLIGTLKSLEACRVISPGKEHLLIEDLQVSGSRVSLSIGNELFELLSELALLPTLDSIPWIR